ncbi:rod shape-determining protein MreC [Persicimonas caeni]|jgi:rod shape-determining protein MreC|uniref:Cell shape-determining protein MreC n=1 Tax=Persicimonas caeni TaxID=2292766 RepID=A0A4Y6Q1R5_PERCE|nr:rod shape-determining protein MreC [Persicimonas caeni]QDG54370.1 rod shape-determining protein MreC [Persicimonas caeni]QED35591.1 rod shape-determining protein MreC [Persicimonas caeni]
MYDFLSNHRPKLVALLLVALPLVMLASAGDARVGHEPSSKPVQVVRSGLAWTELGAYRSVGWLGDAWARLVDGELADENEKLRKEVARLREEKSRLIGVLQENARLRDLVGFKKRHPEFEMVPARVVGRDISPYFRVLRLKLESNQKLKPRQPVVVASGVVGQIHEVYGQFAEVIIVSDPRSRIDAVSQRNRAPGIVEGLGHERDYLARVSYLNQKDEMREGDVMVTGGKGGVFPKELVIGTVTAVDNAERGLFQQVRLEPAVDFSRLEEVFVITGTK